MSTSCLPEAATSPATTSVPATASLVAVPVGFDSIPREAWDRLLASTPAATPFSRWTVHRAWWDAYGETAHEQYLVCCTEADATAGRHLEPDAIRGIVPLMHRHEVEPQDAATATALRRRSREGTAVRPDAKAVFFGASYHADYATLLAAREDLPAVAGAFARSCDPQPDPEHGDQPWDVIDLRRLRADDPALPALDGALREAAATRGWDVCLEEEDVCPVATLPEGGWDAYLATLSKHDRHEVRRKLRRAAAAGDVRFSIVEPTAAAVDTFIALHQARWGEEGLFPRTEGGTRSRRFLHRMAALEAQEGAASQLQLGQLEVGDRLLFATVGFDDGSTCYFYNAGMAPGARALAPGVIGTAAYIRDRQAAGRRRFDFLRGNEPYKYEWGAVDEPVHRLLVTRRGVA
jgi:hypothetical protein